MKVNFDINQEIKMKCELLCADHFHWPENIMFGPTGEKSI